MSLDLLMSLLSALILLPSLSIYDIYDLLFELFIAAILVVVISLILYSIYNLDQKFYLTSFLIFISGYTAILTSFGTKLTPSHFEDVPYTIFVIIFLVINLICMILIIGPILNRKVVLPLTSAMKTSNEVKNLLEIQKRELSNFAHTMAHDLRSGLTNIRLYTDLLEEQDPNNVFLDKINKQLINIDGLMNKSVKLAKEGLIIGLKKQTNLKELIEEVADITLPKNINFEISDLPKSIMCDKEKIYQVLKNIFENAIIHSRPSYLQINFEKQNKNSLLKIVYDGEKFKESTKKNFNKSRDSIIKNNNVGLGLILIKRIIDAHNWKVRISDSNSPCYEIYIPTSDVKEY
ncbi:MAG: Osmolarity sensor protein EnvZ [Candidatus Heimdallarchaeota archaeon LC_3]|nr:MAG: Osmolarity sensor protein EnvZ [Candidatus Heimdallarchaeota archaeon LC_3]